MQAVAVARQPVRSPRPQETLPAVHSPDTSRLPRSVRRTLDRRARLLMQDMAQHACAITGRP